MLLQVQVGRHTDVEAAVSFKIAGPTRFAAVAGFN